MPVWSKTGHRVIGEVAQEHLSAKAKRAIKKLLKGKSLATVSNFGDEIKADSIYKKFSSWHYVNIPHGKKYTEITPFKYGDLVTGIQECIRIIKDVSSAEAEKVFYLKMLVHLIGDLHQPMHVGRLEDKGGNDIQLQWFNDGTNLHQVWDAKMIDDYGMSFTELRASLPQISNNQKKAMQEGSLLDWVEESHLLADEVYESVEVGEKLYYRYGYVWWATVEVQLQKGGLRLAKVLNELF
ncbi:MAG: S1/P1 nuclease [Flavobacteriaceae bacterium]